MNQDYLDIGALIKRVRKANDLTQEELAAEVGVSQSSITGYENGRSEPGLTFLKGFRSLFGYDLLDENITNAIIVKTYDKEKKQRLWNIKKPAPSLVADLLTLGKQLADFKSNFDRLTESLAAPVSESEGQTQAFENLVEDKSHQTIDKP